MTEYFVVSIEDLDAQAEKIGMDKDFLRQKLNWGLDRDCRLVAFHAPSEWQLIFVKYGIAVSYAMTVYMDSFEPGEIAESRVKK